MSVFQVRLISPSQGAGYATDSSAVAGVSKQKTMSVEGPNGIKRVLNDGETFTSTNYWKRYASVAEGGLLPADVAFIHVVTDDGSVWSNTDGSINVYPVVISKTIVAGTTFTAANNIVDILGTYGAVATFAQFTCSAGLTVRLNSSATAEMDLESGVQSFDHNDLPLSSLAFDNSASGASDVTVEIVLTLATISND